MLIHFGVKPYVVFDGDYLPSKSHTEKERAARRKESKRLGLELLRMGKISQAYLELQKAVDVTPLMARELIEELKSAKVDYVVAPYEADSQMAFLEKQGIISGILSEDSDLLVFGAQTLLTKLDQYGECVMIRRQDFTACREVSLVGWSDREFRMMAVLSGCDYLPGIDKMGLKTAYRLVRKHKQVDRVVRSVQFDGKMKVPTGYLEAFTKAEQTFLYQWVFCPEARGLVNLNKVPAGLSIEDMPYVGSFVPPSVAAAVAVGDLDPNTKRPLVVAGRLNHPASRSRPLQTPDEKQGKPISEFFKPKRTPLAELDPNSFTPSPSQQRLLESQHSTSWSASQVQAMRPPLLSRAATMQPPSSAPQVSRRTASAQEPLIGRVSPKRQRLCSDSVLAASMGGSVGLPASTSRFFSKQASQASPSLRKRSAQRKQEDFDLWSDDSVAEAVAEIAERVATPTNDEPHLKAPVSQSPRKRKRLHVYTDQSTSGNDKAPPTDTSQDTTTSAATAESQAISRVETPLTSFEDAEPVSKPSVFTKGIDADFAALQSRCTYKPNTPKPSVQRTKSTPLSSRTPLQETQRNEVLGRLAVSAHSPSKLEAVGMLRSPEAAPSSSPISTRPAQIAPRNHDDEEIDDEDWLAMEQEYVGGIPRNEPKGSEDLFIPDSPRSEETDDGRLKPKLDLGRFAFAGP